MFAPVERAVRNETNFTHREIIVESRISLQQYDPFQGNYDSDLFVQDPRSLKPTWIYSITRGSLTAQKTQLAPGDHFSVGTPDHLLIALDDLQLTSDGPKKAKDIRLNRGEAATLEGGAAFTLTNGAKVAFKFILVEL